MSIKAVTFDYGGVISFKPTPKDEAELEHITGLSGQRLWELYQKYRKGLDRGTYNGPEFFGHIMAEEGIFPGDEVLEKMAQVDMAGWKRLDPGTTQLMRDIKTAGILLGVLSNMPHDFLAWARQNVPVFSEADRVIFSCECSLIKPEPAIYEKLKKTLGCEYAEIVFFDDLTDNISKAREMGILGFVWEGPQEARKILKSFGKGLAGL